MGALTWVWYILAGFLLGWVLSTLTEWLWFRQRRLQGQQPTPSPAATTPPPPHRTDAQDEFSLFAPAAGEDVEPTLRPDVSTPPTEASTLVQPSNYPDPLSQIRGIGVVYEKRLYNAGIFTWHQIANTDPQVLRATTHAQANSNPEAWIDQARQLAEEHDRIGAIYTGPIPDDFTRIDGIGSNYERDLYRAGIYTYEQLGQLTPFELAEILPEAGAVGEEIDYQLWIEQAARLSAAA